MELPLNSAAEPKQSWLDRPLFNIPVINMEKLIFAIILIIAIFTRFYMLEARVMSHDETSHTYFSWLFFKGNVYMHDPVTHGPLQFHLVALSYFLFGDTDTTARIPAALFSIATVAFMWAYRRYLGRAGALIAALLLTISPFMLYYGRYVRNEAFVAFWGVVMLWSMLRYFDTGKHQFLYIFTIVTVLHFATKETSFIYSAQALLFLAFYLIYRLTKRQWKRDDHRSYFLYSTLFALLFLALGVGIKYLAGKTGATEQPLYPQLASIPAVIPLILIVLSVLGAALAIYFAITGFGLDQIRQERSFDLLMLLGTLVLPQLSAFGIDFFGWTVPVNAAEVHALTFIDLVHMALIVIPVFIISIVLGLLWNRRQWLINAGIWYAIYIVFYTSMFTNVEAGFFTGLVGSLGYWLAQQSVNRGDQPLYYYALIQIPMYEFLPAIGSLIGIVLALFGRKTVPDAAFVAETPLEKEPEVTDDLTENDELDEDQSPLAEPSIETVEEKKSVWANPPVVGLLIFWSITSLLAYSIAGEKMPWLTVHITLPMILLSAWSIGYLVDTTDWAAFRRKKGWLGVGLLFIFVPALLSMGRILLGNNPPFAGKSLEQLAATSGFVIALLVTLATAVGLVFLTRDWTPRLVRRGLGFVFLGILVFLTARSGFIASFINYDLAKEYLVYAHCAPGDKIALQQITDISRRLTGSLELTVAYDDLTTYPFWWYLRNFPNQRFYGSSPTKDLRDVDVILVGQKNFPKIEPVVGQAYNEFDYIRLWWPNQDYYNLTPQRLWYALTNGQMREAILRIWLNRDYSLYGQLVGQDLSL